MSWYAEGNVAQCRRCYRAIELTQAPEPWLRVWRPAPGTYPQDCPARPGDPCTPHDPE